MILSPRAACLLAGFLALVLLATIVFAAMKPAAPSTFIHPCAAVLERGNEQVCR